MTGPLLFSVWVGWSTEGNGNRHELLRILADRYEDAVAMAKVELLRPDVDIEVHEDDNGYHWDERPDVCNCDDEDDHDCWIFYYIDLEQWNDYTEDDLRLRLLTPTLGMYDAFRDISTSPG